MLWSLLMSGALAGDTVFGAAFAPETALMFDHPRLPGALTLILAEAELTCDQARDDRVRAQLLQKGTRMVIARFEPGVAGTISREVAVLAGIQNMAVGPQATLDVLPSAPGPGGQVTLDVTALKPGGEVGARLSSTVSFTLCPSSE